MMKTSGKNWFYSQGQSLRASGKLLQEHHIFWMRNKGMVHHFVWNAFVAGYEGL